MSINYTFIFSPRDPLETQTISVHFCPSSLRHHLHQRSERYRPAEQLRRHQRRHGHLMLLPRLMLARCPLPPSPLLLLHPLLAPLLLLVLVPVVLLILVLVLVLAVPVVLVLVVLRPAVLVVLPLLAQP